MSNNALYEYLVLERSGEKKRIFRAAGIDLTIDSSSPLKKLMAKRGVLE